MTMTSIKIKKTFDRTSSVSRETKVIMEDDAKDSVLTNDGAKEVSKEQQRVNIEHNDTECVEQSSPHQKKGSDVEEEHCQSESSLEENTCDQAYEEDSDMRYVCPICDTILYTTHEFTLHIRSHNNDYPSTECPSFSSVGKGFLCRICGKILSSSSSLDRHVLVHTGERPFKCKICGFSFTTNGNMHRHMRTHTNTVKSDSYHNYESDVSSDSCGSRKNISSPPLSSVKKRKVSRTDEFNNNIEMSPKTILYELSNKRKSAELDETQVPKRKLDIKNKNVTLQKYKCNICDRDDFISLNVLETHLENNHPEHKAKCETCNIVFKNHRALNLHRFMIHFKDPELENHLFSSNSGGTVGFNDLTFVDFSSQKFPHIARVICEQSLHHASSIHQKFQCDKCQRAFPCSSALKIHEQNCGNENYASSGESYHNDNDLSSSDNDLPTDLSSSHTRPFTKRNSSESSEDIDEERKREHFFAGLHLQNIRSLSPSFNSSDETALIDYKNRVCLNMNAEGKDLADIQSIISVTSTGGLLPDLSKSPQPTILEVTPPDSGSRNCVYDSAVTEEEQQDCFAADFRKMKLRGEFPCRLCTAVFPNLRALKGHNRVHLSSNTGGSNAPYRCNMCPHSSSDKSALIRHMRTHNGDRPYECCLCHYAFTTKANCERHLRNRHSKMSREEVKKSIIYHPSEDPTNDIEVKINRDDVKRSLFTEKDVAKENHSAERQETNTETKIIKPHFDNELRSTVEDSEKTCNEFITSKNSSNPNENDKEHNYRKSLDVGTMTFEEENYINRSDISVDSKTNNIVGVKYNINTSETPLDLTMDVLDLSKKKPKEELNVEGEDKDQRKQDLSSVKKFREDIPKTSSPVSFGMGDRQKTLCNLSVPFNHDIDVLQSSHSSLKNFDNKNETSNMTPHIGVPKLDLTSLYSVNTHLTNPFYLGNSHGFSAFSTGSPYPPNPLPPYFIPPPPPPPQHLMFSRNPTQDFVDMKDRLQKELIRGLQLTSGGSLVLDQFAMASAADRIQTLHQQALAEFSRRLETSKQEIKRMSPLIKSDSRSLVETELNKKKQDKTPVTTTMLKSRQDSSSVKMVIKNGVLIPKQKQRRYRTERPFSCEHCSARFTLRSNMERHIKQQHPQFWTQRQRNSGSNTGSRRGALHSAKVTQSNITSSDNEFYNHLNSSMYKKDNDVTSLRPSTPKSETKYENSEDIRNLNFENKSYISDEVKHAITQQLKSKLQTTDEKKLCEKNDELEDENEELIIDEGTRDDEDIKKKEERNQEENQDVISSKNSAKEESVIDLASVSRLLDNASTQTFRQYFRSDDEHAAEEISEEDEEGLVASSASEGNNSGSDENRSETDTAMGSSTQAATKKKSAYSLAPNRVSCPYCYRKFPWSSSLRRHILTHTGQKPYKCSVCPLLFTTKSNCDRHLLRKHGGSANCATTTETNQCTSDSSGNQTMQQNYTMRNVPERPYKCKFCPSSTFSTLSNLKKHIVSKHQHNSKPSSGFDSHGSSSDVEPSDSAERERQSRDSLEVEKENQSVSDDKEIYLSHSAENQHTVKAASIPSVQSESTYPISLTTDLPFKCHLCDGMSFSERQDALEHIKEKHQREFELLVSKGALETGGSNEDNPCPEDGGGEENLEQLRGKFPDYANRKVMCAFCLRRFWSAEDLRRHMRTHTGERPFSCDICRRRFTLKHSMLRHRKKHSFPSVPQEETSPTSDEETNNQGPSLCQGSNAINNNVISSIKKVERQKPEEETDLISNLLGIQDKSIVDKMLLSKSADDAAKLLGVHK